MSVYRSTTHPDIHIRDLDPTDPADRNSAHPAGLFFCHGCSTAYAVHVIRHMPTGSRQFVCSAPWHHTIEAIAELLDDVLLAEKHQAQWAAEDDAYMQAHPEDTATAERIKAARAYVCRLPA